LKDKALSFSNIKQIFPEYCGIRTQDNTCLFIEGDKVLEPCDGWDELTFYVIRAQSEKSTPGG
jgi:hypothetical protein